jgi:thiol-disulfide isomerase/thioredoxin
MNTTASQRRRWLYAAVAAVAGIGGAVLAWRQLTAREVSEPPPDGFWSLEFDRPPGGKLSLATMRGRPLLVNFWATWCPPCIEELPLLDAFYRENQSNGWQILAVAVDKRAAVTDFLSRHPVSFPIALADTDGIALSKSLGNFGAGLPFSVAFGADGSVRHRKLGKLSRDDLAIWRRPK